MADLVCEGFVSDWSIADYQAIRLSGEQIDEVKIKLLDLRKGLHCAVCGDPDLDVVPFVKRVDFGINNDNPIGITAVTTLCLSCGLISHHSAKVLKVKLDEAWESKPVESEEDKSE